MAKSVRQQQSAVRTPVYAIYYTQRTYRRRVGKHDERIYNVRNAVLKFLFFFTPRLTDRENFEHYLSTYLHVCPRILSLFLRAIFFYILFHNHIPLLFLRLSILSYAYYVRIYTHTHIHVPPIIRVLRILSRFLVRSITIYSNGKRSLLLFII